MTPQERHDVLQQIAGKLWEVRQQIETLTPDMTFDVDRRAAESILTDLTWATENCTVIALHQIGEAMDDAMGMAKDGRVS